MINYNVGSTVRGTALASPLRREVQAALIASGSARSVDGCSVNAPPTLGAEIAITYDAALTAPETATCAAAVAAHDVDIVEAEELPTLPAQITLNGSYAALVNWTIPEDRTCTYELDLRGRYSSGANLEGVRIQCSGVAQRPTGEDVDRETPEIRRSPSHFRCDVKEEDSATLSIRIKVSGSGGTLVVSPESILKVVIQ